MIRERPLPKEIDHEDENAQRVREEASNKVRGQGRVEVAEEHDECPGETCDAIHNWSHHRESHTELQDDAGNNRLAKQKMIC
jgi:hypothetical protein